MTVEVFNDVTNAHIDSGALINCTGSSCATGTSACVSGSCTCLGRPGDTSMAPADMGTTTTTKAGKHGCSAAPGAPTDAEGALCLIGLALLFVARRARLAHARQ